MLSCLQLKTHAFTSTPVIFFLVYHSYCEFGTGPLFRWLGLGIGLVRFRSRVRVSVRDMV